MASLPPFTIAQALSVIGGRLCPQSKACTLWILLPVFPWHGHTSPPHMLDKLSCWLQVRGALRAATVPVSITQLLKVLSLLGLSSASSTVNAVITELVQVRCSPEAYLSGSRDLWAAVLRWMAC